MQTRWLFLLAGLMFSMVLMSCGGGGATPNVIKGVAATGAPIANAAVFIKDANGKEPTGQDAANSTALVTTDANGNYEFTATMMQGLTSPFIIRVVGTKVLDSGDDAIAILHAVVASTVGATANITPLTEALTILTLGPDTATSFSDPKTALENYTAQAAKTANDSLLAKLTLPAALSGYDLVSGALDASPTTDLSSPSPAKLYDLLLDTLAYSSSQGSLIFSDRNQPEDQYVNGPEIKVTPGGTSSSPSASLNRARMMAAAPRKLVATDSMSGIQTDGILDSSKLQAFIGRLNTQLRAGCTVPLDGIYNNTCGNVSLPSNGVFSNLYKHTGMTADKWLSYWVAAPLEVEDLTDMTVSLLSAYRGSFMVTSTQRVTRVALDFVLPNGDHVVRTMILADENPTDVNANIVVFGNQKDYLLWAKPRFSVNTDADDTYPYNPKYQVGIQFVVKPWFGGADNMIIGAHIQGPGLPGNGVDGAVARSTSGLNSMGENSNPNSLTQGLEVFWRTDPAVSCSSMPVDNSVYVEKNIKSWNDAWNTYRTDGYQREVLYNGDVRWRTGSTTCDPTFDMRRYYTPGELATLVLPKRGDSYQVTLYLDADKWTNSGEAGKTTVPSGALPKVTGKVNSDGKIVSYYPLVVTETLRADAFTVPSGTATVAADSLPGVTDATRARLLTLQKGDDRQFDWTRNLVTLPETDASNQTTLTNFGNFYGGVYTGSKDQWNPADRGYVGFSPRPTAWGSSISNRGFKDYREFFTLSVLNGHLIIDTNGNSSGRLDLDCGNSVSYKGATVRVRVRRVSNPTDSAFPYESATSAPPGNTNNRVYEEVSCAKAQQEIAAAYSSTTWNDDFLGYTVAPAAGAPTIYVRYQYDVVRDRVDFKGLKTTLLNANQTSRTMTWAQMMAKEKVGSVALCSSLNGAFPYRSAFVVMADMNGRLIEEKREVWADFPGMSATDMADPTLAMASYYTTQDNLTKGLSGTSSFGPPNIRAIDISRPNYLSDAVYIPMSFEVTGYELLWTIPDGVYSYEWKPSGKNWHNQPGIIQPAYEKASAGATTCTPKIW